MAPGGHNKELEVWVGWNLARTFNAHTGMSSGIPVDDHLSYVTTSPRRPNFPSPEQFPL
jgi:hypothetical protein